MFRYCELALETCSTNDELGTCNLSFPGAPHPAHHDHYYSSDDDDDDEDDDDDDEEEDRKKGG